MSSGLQHGSQSSDGTIGVSLLVKLNPSLVLENSGSVARDHLASERTYLAYVRTSLTIATTGVALVQLFTVAANTNSDALSSTVKRLQKFARPIGATMVAFGLAVLALGVRRYFLIQASLSKGIFPISRFGIAGITIILAVVIIVVFAVLV
ncbi:hypothetical protein L208DRAFT_1266624 [Tricholoma matsutake]|nr:hypothetical protein L208DRAFT_1266624 [Tricholoma matsutake 945]